MQYFIFFFWLIFGVVNLQIILGDLKKKKIYNKYLLFLLLLGCIYIFRYILEGGNIYPLFYSFPLSVVIGFVCYYFSLLGAGDIKYIVILGLFIQPESYLTLISNIALISLPWVLYSLIKEEKIEYLQKKVRKKLGSISLRDIKETGNFIFILEFLNSFFILFILIKIGRIYMNQILGHSDMSFGMIIIISFIVTISLIYIGKYIWNKISEFINHRYGVYKDSLSVIGVSILFFILAGVIYKEYSISRETLLENIYKILTLYLILYLSVRLLFVLYKSIYDESEKVLISPSELQEGDKIDAKYFQESLLPDIENISKQEKETLEYMSGALDKDEIHILQKIYSLAENDIKIKIYKTTHFSQNIFLGFLITFIFGDLFIQEIMTHLHAFILHFLGGS